MGSPPPWTVTLWSHWPERLQRGALYALLALLPFSKAAVEICFGLLLIGWVAERSDPATRGRTVWRSPQLWPVLAGLIAYLLVCALSVLSSEFPDKSLRGLISKWLEYFLFLVIAADLSSRPRVIGRSLTVLAWSASAVALLGLWQERQIYVILTSQAIFPADPIGAYHRMTGPYENPIDLATYFMVVLPVVLALCMIWRGWHRWILAVLIVVLLGCLARTEALGAWIGLAVGLAVVGLAERIWRWRALVMVACLGVGALAVLGWTGHLARFSLLDIGTRDRWIMWQAAIRMIQDRPWLGHGVNTFMANYLRYRVGGEAFPRYAHNCYLQVAAETGLIGLTAFLWLLWRIGVHIARGVRQAGSEHRMLLLGLGGGLLAFLVQAGLDTNFYALRQAALFWVLSGLAIGLSVQQQREASS